MTGWIKMDNKMNIVLVDTLVSDDWEFATGLELGSEQKWRIIKWNNAGLKNNKLHNIKRLFGYFFYSLQIFLKRKKYLNIVAWQQFYGLIFAFYCNLFKVRKENTLIVMTFIFKEKKGRIGKIYKKFVRDVVKSDYIDKLVVFSEHEIEHYSTLFSVSKDKFQFFNLGIEKKKELEKTKVDLKYPFLLAVGRSNRDYSFLFSCVENMPWNIVVLTDELNYEGLVPSNVQVFNNIRGEEYLKILNESFAVLIPLQNSNISSGQLVMLQAMQYKKPIIITESETIGSYVQHNINALVVKKERGQFNQAIKLLYEDEVLYKRLTDNGKKIFENNFSLLMLGKNVGKLGELTVE